MGLTNFRVRTTHRHLPAFVSVAAVTLPTQKLHFEAQKAWLPNQRRAKRLVFQTPNPMKGFLLLEANPKTCHQKQEAVCPMSSPPIGEHPSSQKDHLLGASFFALEQPASPVYSIHSWAAHYPNRPSGPSRFEKLANLALGFLTIPKKSA